MSSRSLALQRWPACPADGPPRITVKGCPAWPADVVAPWETRGALPPFGRCQQSPALAWLYAQATAMAAAMGMVHPLLATLPLVRPPGRPIGQPPCLLHPCPPLVSRTERTCLHFCWAAHQPASQPARGGSPPRSSIPPCHAPPAAPPWPAAGSGNGNGVWCDASTGAQPMPGALPLLPGQQQRGHHHHHHYHHRSHHHHSSAAGAAAAEAGSEAPAAWQPLLAAQGAAAAAAAMAPGGAAAQHLPLAQQQRQQAHAQQPLSPPAAADVFPSPPPRPRLPSELANLVGAAGTLGDPSQASADGLFHGSNTGNGSNGACPWEGWPSEFSLAYWLAGCCCMHTFCLVTSWQGGRQADRQQGARVPAILNTQTSLPPCPCCRRHHQWQRPRWQRQRRRH